MWVSEGVGLSSGKALWHLLLTSIQRPFMPTSVVTYSRWASAAVTTGAWVSGNSLPPALSLYISVPAQWVASNACW